MKPLLAWALYWVGDGIYRLQSIFAEDLECVHAFLNDAYQAVMRASNRAQGDGKGPWQ